MAKKNLSAIILGSAISFSGCTSESSTSSSLFPQEKILTISAKDYCESVGKNVSDYKFVGLMVVKTSGGFPTFSYKNVPEGTEVIVDFSMARNQYAGTALVPKK